MKKIALKIWVLILGVLCTVSCTVYDNPEPYFEDNDNIESPSQRKILLISIDGLPGRELQKEVPQNLTAIMDKSKYTFNSLSDEASSSASTWTTMMTGVASSVHHVEDDTFRAKADENDQHADIAFTPSIFYRLFFTRPEYNTTVISSWENLVKKLLIEVETQIVSDNDVVTRDSAVSHLTNQDPEIMIVNFRSVYEAGENAGFNRDNSDYNEAIHTVDGYIGDIMQALEARKNYDKEEWMVIITSNQGGSEDGSTGTDSFDDRNTFTFLHYKTFTKQEINPALINSGNFTQLATNEANYSPTIMQAENATDYDFKSDAMSVEFKFKRNTSYPWSGQPFILGKSARHWSHASGTGWAIGTENNKLRLYLTFDNNQAVSYAFNTDINDFKWHHFSFSLRKTSNSTVEINLYNDGVTAGNYTLTMNGNANAVMSSTAALFVGPRRSHNGTALSREDINMADLRIYNTAITSADADRLSCLINTLPEEDALTPSLIGSYDISELEDSSIKNKVEGKPHLKSINSNLPKFGKSLISNKCNAEDRNNLLITNEDIATMMLYWLRITPDISWRLTGNKILNNYEEEFIVIKK